ncbi:hypothetical protein P5G61_16065 [Paenibacillus sp. F6_3S_P_1C]|uniref:Transposase n=1 Tax=Paenibacillus vandeheii TaxID=3035917 RepID=A0ABT8JCC4_9BACL|nr:hypothetical protein [Paenibacillus vandeheii]MDN4602754.1 hypothetical protein [Paenibacillus vandeheii]
MNKRIKLFTHPTMSEVKVLMINLSKRYRWASTYKQQTAISQEILGYGGFV